MKVCIYSLFLSLLLLSCFKSEKSPYLILDPKEHVSEFISISEFVDTVMYIPLDTSMLIKGIGRHFLIDDDCMFFDTNEGVLKYSRQGIFLQKIGRVGGAPQEYTNYRAIAMDKENERIYVYSLPRKLIVYNFDGEFLNFFSVELPDDGLYPIQMYYRNGLIYFFYRNCLGGETRKSLFWVITDTKGQMKTFRRSNEIQLGADYAASYGLFGVNVKDADSFVYWDLFNDTVFHVNGMEAKIVYL